MSLILLSVSTCEVTDTQKYFNITMDKIPQNVVYTYYFDTTILTVRLTPYAISIKLASLVSVYSRLKPFL